MKKNCSAAIVVVLVMAGMTGMASGALLTFETLPTIPNGGYSISGSIIEEGFEIAPLYPVYEGGLSAFGDGWQSNRGSSNGTTVVGLWRCSASSESMELTAVDDSLFTLESIDLAELFQPDDFLGAFQYVATDVAFTGYKENGTEVYYSFEMDLISDGSGGEEDFQTVLFDSSWTCLTSVVVTATGASTGAVYVAFDNIAVTKEPASPVPVPASLLLLATGLAGLGGLRKRFER